MWYAASWPPRSHWISLPVAADGLGLGAAGVAVGAWVGPALGAGDGDAVAAPLGEQATAARTISSSARTRRTVSTAANDSGNRANGSLQARCNCGDGPGHGTSRLAGLRSRRAGAPATRRFPWPK